MNLKKTTIFALVLAGTALGLMAQEYVDLSGYWTWYEPIVGEDAYDILGYDYLTMRVEDEMGTYGYYLYSDELGYEEYGYLEVEDDILVLMPEGEEPEIYLLEMFNEFELRFYQEDGPMYSMTKDDK